MQPSVLTANHRHRIALLATCLGAFALRLFHLGAESLWYDETVSVVLARQSVPALLAHTAGDIHPPGYYLFLHFWQALTQPSLVHGLEFLYAWPSLFFGILIVALLYPLGQALADRQSALLAVALAACNPFQLWYSQEVRMYTLGGALGLLCLWSVLKYLQLTPRTATRPQRWLLLYVLSGAAGLYTLYYFLFLVIPLNLFVLWHCFRSGSVGQSSKIRTQQFITWLLAQLGILLLWLPWLPIFWHQAVEPPVPPWRTPWQDLPAFVQSLSETLSTLLVGQGAPDQLTWPWAVLTILVIALYWVYVKCSNVKGDTPKVTAQRLTLTYLFGPILLIDLITLTVTPLYHVRYLFTYAPPLLLLVAMGIQALQRWRRGTGAVVLGLLLAISGWRLQQFWFDPRLRTDDHRTAVADIAAHWRPGDVILVNAGWVYTVFVTYWPTELADPTGALPPPIDKIIRLGTKLNPSVPQNNPNIADSAVTLVRTGSVDGSPQLGWGDPASDFFAISSQASSAAIQQLAGTHQRIWHYRLYDTVNDPQGILRAQLATQGTLVRDEPISGRDFLRLQLYQTQQPRVGAAPNITATLRFEDVLQLSGYQIPPGGVAGTMLYVTTHWQALAGLRQLPAALNFSLRLYDDQDQLLAQHDQPAWPPTTEWQPLTDYPLELALPLPAATPPGDYQLALVVYAADSGEPLRVGDQPVDRRSLVLGRLPITVATQAPAISQVRATFDYIDLVTAQVQPIANQMQIKLIWRPRPNPYTDTYLVAIELRNANAQVVQRWIDALGGWQYPSAGWPPGVPVQEKRQLDLPADLPSGVYSVYLQLLRNSDQHVIAARQGWWPLPATDLAIGEIRK